MSAITIMVLILLLILIIPTRILYNSCTHRNSIMIDEDLIEITFIVFIIVFFFPMTYVISGTAHTIHDNGIEGVETLISHSEGACGAVATSVTPSPENGKCNAVSGFTFLLSFLTLLDLYVVDVAVAKRMRILKSEGLSGSG